jgi:chemotaxis family two-component system sensor kinase Cph1
MIGSTVSDVVLQFRAVRTLVAQDQLNLVRHQVGVSALAVVIADRDGRIILANAAFRSLLSDGTPVPDRITGLSDLFLDVSQMRRRIEQLVEGRRSWRGELLLRPGAGPATPLMIRADPVLASSDRVLGFVLLFTDLSERHAADGARRRFQEALLAGSAAVHGRLKDGIDRQTGQLFNTLLASIVENAEVAALEIADGSDTRQIPRLLEAVETSVQNAAEALEHLVRHTDETSPPIPRELPR